jgi:hypothetical protein
MILRKEQRLKVFVGMVLRRIFGPRSDEVTGDWINCITNSFTTYTLRQV